MPKFDANLTMLYTEHGFLDRFAAAAKDGFEGVEYLFPYDFPKEQLAEQLEKNGLDAGPPQPPGRRLGRRRARDRAPSRPRGRVPGRGRPAIEYATALGCRQVNCLAGKAPEGVAERQGPPHLRRQPQVRGPEAEAGRDQAADRAGQHPRHPGLLPALHRAGRGDPGRDRLGQPLHPVRLLPHAGDAGRHRQHLRCGSRTRSPTSRSPTIRAATSPAPARSTTPSSSTCWTARGTRAGLGSSTSRRAATSAGLGWLPGRTR